MKGKQLLKTALDNSYLYVKRNSTTILSGVAVIGLVATSISTAKATIKAVEILNEAECEKKEPLTKSEVVKLTAKCYIPPIIIGTSTVMCILGANILNKRQQASLISAYTFLDNSFKEYKAKLKEIYGEEAHNKIIDAIAVEKARQVDIYSNTCFSSCNLAIEDGTSEPRMFYDLYSSRYFESTIERVLNAEYHFNRNYILRGDATVNELYEFLGVEKLPHGDSVGWSYVDGLYWIDFEHRKVTLEDGLECYVIDTPFGPTPDFLDDY